MFVLKALGINNYFSKSIIHFSTLCKKKSRITGGRTTRVLWGHIDWDIGLKQKLLQQNQCFNIWRCLQTCQAQVKTSIAAMSTAWLVFMSKCLLKLIGNYFHKIQYFLSMIRVMLLFECHDMEEYHDFIKTECKRLNFVEY